MLCCCGERSATAWAKNSTVDVRLMSRKTATKIRGTKQTSFPSISVRSFDDMSICLVVNKGIFSTNVGSTHKNTATFPTYRNMQVLDLNKADSIFVVSSAREFEDRFIV